MKALLLGLLLCLSASAQAADWVVEPGQSLAQTLQRAADGDSISLKAGDYRGQVAVITHQRLTLRGMGGRAVLHADGQIAEGKAILVVRGGDIRIENLEFRGARVPEKNGAGIRFERGRLVVSRCVFGDNEKSILTANVGTAELVVEDSEFGEAPPHSQLPHLVYVGQIARFTLSNSRVGGGDHGHLVKSRARENVIRNNRLVDGPGGRAAYELEFPNGGLAWVVGNVIAQSADSSNPAIVSFGAEGAVDDREQGLFMAHNTLINAGDKPAIFVHLHPLGGRLVEQRFVNNLVLGPGTVEGALADAAQGNVMGPVSVLDASGALPYALRAGSPLRGRGVEPGAARGVPLRLPAGAAPGWTPGAYPST